MDIQITNISLQIIEADLRRLFTPFGEVATVQLVRDRWSNRSTGRAFVNMPVEKQALAAVATLNGSLLAGKAIVVAAFS